MDKEEGKEESREKVQYMYINLAAQSEQVRVVHPPGREG